MTNLEDLERKYEELGREIEKLKNGANAKKLRLFSNENSILVIYYGVYSSNITSLCFEGVIGYIDTEGYCHILDTKDRVAVYNAWLADGRAVDETSVKWRGEVYALNSMGTLRRNNLKNGNIYYFSEPISATGCQDPNIQRHMSNKSPMLF